MYENENFSDAYFADSYQRILIYIMVEEDYYGSMDSFMRKIKNHLWLKKKIKKILIYSGKNLENML